MGGTGPRLIRLLAEHGVPERSARIYLAAVRSGPQTVAELARVAAVHRVEAYRFIRQLETDGLLTSSGQRPMRFAALPPEELLERWIRSASDRLKSIQVDRDRTLSELAAGAMDMDVPEARTFHVLEGTEAIFRFLCRRIGTARSEIRASIPGYALSLVVEGGVGRALQEAHDRGVRIRLLSEIGMANRSEAKHFASFTELRHSPAPVTNRAWSIDGKGVLVYVSGPEGFGPARSDQVALWSTSALFLRRAIDFHRRLWRRGFSSTSRLADLENPRVATLGVSRSGASEPFDRLREVAVLGMQATGVEELQIDLPEVIGTIARNLGRQMSGEIEGETPDEVARSLSEFYHRRAMGELEIVRARPLTLKVSQCFACVKQSPEIGRELCSSMLRSVFEARTGGTCEVSKPDPSRHAARGCLFSITPA